jgi:hypothetical protein
MVMNSAWGVIVIVIAIAINMNIDGNSKRICFHAEYILCTENGILSWWLYSFRSPVLDWERRLGLT